VVGFLENEQGELPSKFQFPQTEATDAYKRKLSFG
jgi:hypothetical protein